MKKIFIIIIVLVAVALTMICCACKLSSTETVSNVKDSANIIYVDRPVIVKDTIIDTFYINTIDTIRLASDNSNGRKIERIKYYISICKKNPTNWKYFKGWVLRTMDLK